MRKVIIAIVALLCVATMSGCNRSVLDTKFNFEYAMVQWPDGTSEMLEVKSWRDYDGEQLQITTKDGDTYLINSVNVVLMHEGK